MKKIEIRKSGPVRPTSAAHPLYEPASAASAWPSPRPVPPRAQATIPATSVSTNPATMIATRA